MPLFCDLQVGVWRCGIYEEGRKYSSVAHTVCGDIYIIAALGVDAVGDASLQW